MPTFAQNMPAARLGLSNRFICPRCPDLRSRYHSSGSFWIILSMSHAGAFYQYPFSKPKHTPTGIDRKQGNEPAFSGTIA